MASAAAALTKQSLPRERDAFHRAAGVQPVRIIQWLHHYHAADHRRVLRPAILRTKNVILARLRGPEPFVRVFPRNHILMQPKRGHEKTVDHILRSHRQLYRAVHRHVQFVDFLFPLRVLQTPHPLLANHLNLQRVPWRIFHMKINHRTPAEEADENQQWHNRPSAFDEYRFHPWIRAVCLRAAPIFN